MSTVNDYSIGPFRIDRRSQTITLEPGIYEFHLPVTFRFSDSVITGVTYRPLPAPPSLTGDAPQEE